MQSAFWDSSVLTALCVIQPASTQVHLWTSQFQLVAWWSAHTEIHGAIARLVREGKLQDAERLLAIDRLEILRQEWDEIEPSEEVRYHAARALDSYPLRAADALQLAAALVWCRERPKGRKFLCADERLYGAAEQAGFSVLRP